MTRFASSFRLKGYWVLRDTGIVRCQRQQVKRGLSSASFLKERGPYEFKRVSNRFLKTRATTADVQFRLLGG